MEQGGKLVFGIFKLARVFSGVTARKSLAIGQSGGHFE